MSHELHQWLRLIESEQVNDYYVHVSPIKNLSSILNQGLLPNLAGGNYAGYETSLNGTYITMVPDIIHNHISARAMEDGYILVLVAVAAEHGVIDEDAIDEILVDSVNQALKPMNLTYFTAAEELDPEDKIWRSVVPIFTRKLGPPDRAILRQHPSLIKEYVESFILEKIYGADGDPLYWETAKEYLVAAFPKLTHPTMGARYSLRIPGPIGYDGATCIVAVIAVQRNAAKTVKGKIPTDAIPLIQVCLYQR